jgi:HlyD family secretion protein
VAIVASNSALEALPVLVRPDSPGEAPKAGMSKRRKWIIALVSLVLAVGATGLVAFRWKHPTGAAFRTVRVVRADITERVTATGTLQPVVTSPVGAQVSGIVWKLHADYNSTVKAGDLLVELDPALFRNAVALAVAQLAQAEASLTSAQATALGARIVRDRTRTVERTSLVSKADLDAAQAIFGETKGVARSSAALIAEARAQLDRAQLDLEHSIIHSPVDGTVISRNIDVGQAVAATLTAPTLFTIAQDTKASADTVGPSGLAHMQVHAAVDEADVGQVHAGQSATFTVDAFRDQTFPAVVLEVRNAPVTTQNVVTYDTVLDVENPEGNLRPGMTANVLILIVQKTQVAALPNEALRFRPASGTTRVGSSKAGSANVPLGAAVYVPQEGTAVRVPVTIGVTDGNLTEVLGLPVGREVIIDVARDKNNASSAEGPSRGI